MHRVTLDINDSVFNKVNSLLRIFPEKDLQIISDIKLEKKESQKNRIMDILKKGPFFAEIDDPIAWQREQRDEW